MSKGTQYPIHPDFKRWANMDPPINKATLPMIQRLMGLLYLQEKSTPDLTVERKTIPVWDGSAIRALLYTPKGIGGWHF